MKTLHFIGIFLIGAAIDSNAEIWTSRDGKQIEAEFLKLENGVLHIQAGKKNYAVPIERFDSISRGYADYLQGTIASQAGEKAELPLLTERDLLFVLRHAANLAEGRNYLIEGQVAQIGGGGVGGAGTPFTGVSGAGGGGAGLTGSKDVGITLTGGTSTTVRFDDQVDGKKTKMKILNDRVELWRYTTLDGGSSNSYKNHTVRGNLISEGQIVVLRATVLQGKLQVFGLAKDAEINAARIKIATENGASADDVAGILKLQNRSKYLKAALESGQKGGGRLKAIGGEWIGNLSIEFTDAEKQSMKDELSVIEAQLANR